MHKSFVYNLFSIFFLYVTSFNSIFILLIRFNFTVSGVCTVSKKLLESILSPEISTTTAFASFPVFVNLCVVEIPV